ncbi:MAG TPA: lipid kinase [Gemmatimonadales bacterium]|nr:lipid kinase [Gemmatimonadales bacterium]
MPASRRGLLLANPKARRGMEGVREAASVLEEAGVEVQAEEIGSSREIAEQVTRHSRDVDFIILGGGDGTINAALASLLESRLPLGILPLGTANNTARTLGIPTDLEEAARIIASGRTRRIDVGQVGDRCFLTTASIGLSVRITKELSDASKRRWGPVAYLIAAIRTLSKVHPFDVGIHYDGGSRQLRAIQIMVGNGRHYGAALTVAEDAEPDDALLDCYAIEAVPWWRLLGLLPALKRGRQGEKADVQAITSRTIRIETPEPHAIDADGELVGTTPATFTTAPLALEVFVPGNAD